MTTVILRGYLPHKISGKQKYVNYVFDTEKCVSIVHNWNLLNYFHPKSTYLFKYWDVYLLYSLKVFMYLAYIKLFKKKRGIEFVIDSQENIFLVDILRFFNEKKIMIIFYDFASKNRLLEKKDVKRIKKVKKIIVMTNAIKKELLNKHPKIKKSQVEIIPYKVDSKIFSVLNDNIVQELIKKYDLPEKFFLFVGSEQERKNLFTVLDAFQIFFQKFPKYFFVKIGLDQDAKNRNKLINLLNNDKELKKRFLLIEHCNDMELAAIYNKAHALIFPSTYEGFGIPLVEAMCCGCPIIASKIDTTFEICKNSAVYVEDFHNRDMFLHLMERLTSDKKYYEQVHKLVLKRSSNFSY
jgi:glycosyltransferase involved in cell wall biosynthesis